MSQKVVPCLWFNNNAQETMNYYVGVFPDSHINHVETYPDESLDEHFEGMGNKVICGWCKDKFGVSGQIIPGNMGELLGRGLGAVQAMMQQKIIIKELEAA